MTESDGAGNPASYKRVDAPSESIEGAQWWLIYAIMVANKSADQTTAKLHKLLEDTPPQFGTPFEKMRFAVKQGSLLTRLVNVRSGQYSRIEKSIATVVEDVTFYDPRTWTLQRLEQVPGIGPKTSRWYYLLINKDAKVAALDTHVLKFLKDQNVEKVPQSTPPKGPGYLRLERVFLNYAERFGLSPRDLDFMVWSVYKNKGRILF